MASESQIQEAQAIFYAFEEFLKKQNYKFEIMDTKDAGFYALKYGVIGEDFPMEFNVIVDPELRLLMVKSLQPVQISPEKIAEAAIAVCLINSHITDGSYSLDPTNGMVVFSATTSFAGSLISEEVFAYLMQLSEVIVDDFNDMFVLLQKGAIDLGAFFKRFE